MMISVSGSTLEFTFTNSQLWLHSNFLYSLNCSANITVSVLRLTSEFTIWHHLIYRKRSSFRSKTFLFTILASIAWHPFKLPSNFKLVTGPKSLTFFNSWFDEVILIIRITLEFSLRHYLILLWLELFLLHRCSISLVIIQIAWASLEVSLAYFQLSYRSDLTLFYSLIGQIIGLITWIRLKLS